MEFRALKAEEVYKRILMSGVYFFVFSTFGEEVLIYGCIDSDNQLDYITQAKSMLLDNAPARDLRHTQKTFFHLCSMLYFRQTVSRNMGYEVCQEVPLQSC